MNIMICGSMSFAREMVQAKHELEERGHTVLLPIDIESHVEDPKLIDDLERNHEHVKQNDVLRHCFQNVANSDAILILNKEKNGVKGYIGTSTLMDVGHMKLV
jgi:hypothetical protein